MNEIDTYLADPSKKDRLLARMKNGNAFIFRTINGVKQFYPSRLVGYKNKDIEKYINNIRTDEGSGTETNGRIKRIIKGITQVNVTKVNDPIIIDEFKTFFSLTDLAGRYIFDYDFV